MAIITLTSAKGAPGVSTTALALTLVWEKPVLLVEADSSGGSIMAGYFRGSRPQDRGLIDLAAAHRAGSLEEGIWQAAIKLGSSDTQASTPSVIRWVIPGLSKPSQGNTMAPLWGAIAATLRSISASGIDVIVDAGRINQPILPLFRGSDRVLLVARTDLPAMAAARGGALMLSDTQTAESVGLVLVGEGRPHTAKEMSRRVGLEVSATMAWDARAAAVLSHGEDVPERGRFGPKSRARRWSRTRFVRGSHGAAEQLRTGLDPSQPSASRPRGEHHDAGA